VPLDCGNRIGGLHFVAIPFRHNLDVFRTYITPPLRIPSNARSTLQNCWNSDSVNFRLRYELRKGDVYAHESFKQHDYPASCFHMNLLG
jgi:hypothetical protein